MSFIISPSWLDSQAPLRSFPLRPAKFKVLQKANPPVTFNGDFAVQLHFHQRGRRHVVR